MTTNNPLLTLRKIFIVFLTFIFMEFNEVLKERRSIRNFSVKGISLSQVIEICEAARYSPMAGNIYTIKLILVADKETKLKLADAALEQEFIADAPYILVVCSDLTNLLRSYGENAHIFSRQQAGAAIENIFLKVTELGLGTCWIGAFDEKAVKKILKIPDMIQVEALLPIAIPLSKPSEKKKPDLKLILYFEKWKQSTAKPPKKVPV